MRLFFRRKPEVMPFQRRSVREIHEEAQRRALREFLLKSTPIIYAGFLAEGIHIPDNQNTVELVVDVTTRLYKEIEKRAVDKSVNSGDKK